MSRRRTALLVAAALLGAEVLLRVLPPLPCDVGLVGENRYDVRAARRLAAVGAGEELGDSPLGVLAGLVGLVSPRSFEYNRAGYRGGAWAIEADGRRRVAFLGDSRVFGLHVARDETVAARTEARAGGRIEALNFGVPGTGPWEGLDWILDDVTPYTPAAAVILWDVNPSVRSLVPAARYSRRDAVVANFLRSFALIRRPEHVLRWVVGRRSPSVPTDEFAAQLGGVFDRLEAAGVERIVYLVGWTPMDDVPGIWTAADYERWRAAGRGVAEARGAAVLELEALTDADDYAGVGLHLDHGGSDRVAAAVLAALEAP